MEDEGSASDDFLEQPSNRNDSGQVYLTVIFVWFAQIEQTSSDSTCVQLMVDFTTLQAVDWDPSGLAEGDEI